MGTKLEENIWLFILVILAIAVGSCLIGSSIGYGNGLKDGMSRGLALERWRQTKHQLDTKYRGCHDWEARDATQIIAVKVVEGHLWACEVKIDGDWLWFDTVPEPE